MRARPIITKLEPDTRGCMCCGEPMTREQMSDEKLRMLKVDETGELRFIHTSCGLNHHTENKKRLADVLCLMCGLPLRGDHGHFSGQTITDPAAGEYVGHHVGGWSQCRDGGLCRLDNENVPDISVPSSSLLTRKMA